MHQGTVGGVQSGDHLAVAQVDTNVAVAVLEDDVAGLGVRGGAQLVLHCVGVSGQLDAVLSENPRGEAGAVPCTVALATPNVGAAKAHETYGG